jgi:hypothetical protein
MAKLSFDPIKPSKDHREGRVRQLYPEWPPETIISSRSVTQFDNSDFERARWIWERRPARNISAIFPIFLRRLVCVLLPAAAAPFLPPIFGAVLSLASLIAGCVLAFVCLREIQKWARWRSDYSRAIDRLTAHFR